MSKAQLGTAHRHTLQAARKPEPALSPVAPLAALQLPPRSQRMLLLVAKEPSQASV